MRVEDFYEQFWFANTKSTQPQATIVKSILSWHQIFFELYKIYPWTIQCQIPMREQLYNFRIYQCLAATQTLELWLHFRIIKKIIGDRLAAERIWYKHAQLKCSACTSVVAMGIPQTSNIRSSATTLSFRVYIHSRTIPLVVSNFGIKFIALQLFRCSKFVLMGFLFWFVFVWCVIRYIAYLYNILQWCCN